MVVELLSMIRFLPVALLLTIHAAHAAQNTSSANWPSDEQLIEMTKGWLNNSSGFYSPFDNASFAPDFVFRGPDIGPLNFEGNYKTLMGNGVESAAPHLAFDPFHPNPRTCWLAPEDDAFGRHVYCVLYPTGKHTKDWHSPGGLVKATGNEISSSGEVWSVLWNDYGGKLLVRHISIGYVVTRFRGNGCGFAATFALECVSKGESFWELLAAEISEETVRLPKERSDKKDVPPWWAEFCQTPACP